MWGKDIHRPCSRIVRVGGVECAQRGLVECGVCTARVGGVCTARVGGVWDVLCYPGHNDGWCLPRYLTWASDTSILSMNTSGLVSVQQR